MNPSIYKTWNNSTSWTQKSVYCVYYIYLLFILYLWYKNLDNIYIYMYIYWLVVLTILKNMKVNGKDDIPYIMEK